MRQSIKAAGLASLLLLILTDLSAEPLVKGFFVEKLPANSLNKALDISKQGRKQFQPNYKYHKRVFLPHLI